MKKAALEGKFDYFRMVLGMSRKLIEQFPEDKLSFRPVPEVRSVSEIIAHNYQFISDSVRGIATGTMVDTTPPAFTRKAEMLTWMDEQVAAFFSEFAKLTDAQIEANVTAWGEKFLGWKILGFVYDEHWHHRGQLTVYLRMCGVAPIMLYNYELLQA